MKLGPTQILQSNSGKLYRLRTFASYGSTGWTHWSDCNATYKHPIAPFDTLLLRADDDDQLLWHENLSQVASQVDPLERLNQELDEYDFLPYLSRPVASEYLYAAQHLVNDFDDETRRDRVYMCRQFALWCANDPLRIDKTRTLSKKSKENIEEFILLNDDDSHDRRILRGDCWRMLKNFNLAKRELDVEFFGSNKRIQKVLQNLILEKNSTVVQLDFDPSPINEIVKFLHEFENEEDDGDKK